MAERRRRRSNGDGRARSRRRRIWRRGKYMFFLPFSHFIGDKPRAFSVDRRFRLGADLADSIESWNTRPTRPSRLRVRTNPDLTRICSMTRASESSWTTPYPTRPRLRTLLEETFRVVLFSPKSIALIYLWLKFPLNFKFGDSLYWPLLCFIHLIALPCYFSARMHYFHF